MDNLSPLESAAEAIVSREYAACQIAPDADHDGADGIRCLTALVNGKRYGVGYAPKPGDTATALAEWIIEVVEDACNG